MLEVKKTKQYLMINGTSFGETKIKQSTFFRTDFQTEWNKKKIIFMKNTVIISLKIFQ